MTTVGSKQLFSRSEQNPILSAADWPYPINTAFNAAAALVDGETLLLTRVEDRQGVSHLTAARSADGFSGWRVDAEPTLSSSTERPQEQWGIEDPRITWLESLGVYAVTYTAYSPDGALVALATTKDFRRWQRLGAVMTPDNKDAALLPQQIDSQWVMLHRPMPGMGGGHIWLSTSPDLVHWGNHRVLLRARTGPYWDGGKIGLSAQPLWTERGWLLLYHGVKETCFGSIYRQGLALLDLADPRRVIGRTNEWVFSPETSYERMGDVGNVVFSCGWTLVDGQVRLYYAGADTCMAVATAPLDDVLAALN